VANDQNTYLKRQREMEKKRKAAEKRARRQRKKEEASGASEPDIATPSATEE
jgi:sRNA-binding protein